MHHTYDNNYPCWSWHNLPQDKFWRSTKDDGDDCLASLLVALLSLWSFKSLDGSLQSIGLSLDVLARVLQESAVQANIDRLLMCRSTAALN